MTEDRIERRLAAVVAADVVGYSRLMGADEPGTRARVNGLLDAVIRPAIDECRGRLVKTMGDGFLIEFGSVVDAVQCALDIQSGVAARDRDEPEDRKMPLRVGIHLGDVMVEGDDIHGDGVNIAARLEGLAEPGGICVSDMVHAGVRNKLVLRFDDLGERSLKNIADPLQLFRVVMEQAAADAPSITATGFRRPAVAVLPFENMSGDPEQDYFADGLTEEIIMALSLYRSLPVIARNSTFAFKGTSPDIREVGEQLGARYVVEGSVRKAGSRVRVTCQLINAETGHHVWAERYEREIEDVFALQDEITQRIAAVIEPTIERSERQRIGVKPTSDLAAWEYCLRGYSHLYELTNETNEQARDLFTRAIDLDPDFVRAHAGLAFSHIRGLRFFGTENREETRKLIMESARRAVALDESDSEARVILALSYMVIGEPESGLSEGKLALGLNPNSAFANNAMGALTSLGMANFDEGIPWFEQALLLNPLDPQNHLFLAQLALAHLCAGRYDKAAEYAREAIRRRHDFIESHIALASSLGFLDRPDEARAALEGFKDAAAAFVDRHVVYAQQVKDIVMDGLRKANLVG